MVSGAHTRQVYRSRLRLRLVARDGATLPARRGRSLLPVIGPDDVILPGFEETLGSFAMRAQQGDADARDALYAAFLPKLKRVTRGIRMPGAAPGHTGIWDLDDLDQELYLAFLDLIATWTGDIPFTPFVLSRITFRVKDALRRSIGRPSAPPTYMAVRFDDVDEPEAVHAEPTLQEELMVDRLWDVLSRSQKDLLTARIVHGNAVSTIAEELGISRRTVSRRWRRIVCIAEALLDGPVDAQDVRHPARKPRNYGQEIDS